MKVSYTTKDGRLSFELEADTHQALWRQLAAIQEVFEDRVCTKFGEIDDDVHFVVRKDVEENEYFELRYTGSNPKLFGCKKAFGQNKVGGGLFPRAKDQEGNRLSDNGWRVWDREQRCEV